MKNLSVILLLISLSRLDKTVIINNSVFVTLTMSKPSYADSKEKTFLILTKWSIPKNDTPTLSNFTQQMSITICYTQSDVIHQIEQLSPTEQPLHTHKALLSTLKDKNKTECFFRTTSNNFNTLKIDKRESSDSSELGLNFKVLHKAENNYTLSGQIYSKTLTFDESNVEIAQASKTKKRIWKELISPVFTISHSTRKGIDELIFESVRVIKENTNYKEYLYDGREQHKFVLDIFETIENQNQETFVSRFQKNNNLLFVLDFIDDRFQALEKQDCDKSLIDAFNSKIMERERKNKNKITLDVIKENKRITISMTTPTKISTENIIFDIFDRLKVKGAKIDRLERTPSSTSTKKNTINIIVEGANLYNEEKCEKFKDNKDTTTRLGSVKEYDKKNLPSKNNIVWFILLISFLSMSLLGILVVGSIKYRNYEKGRRRFTIKEQNKGIEEMG